MARKKRRAGSRRRKKRITRTKKRRESTRQRLLSESYIKKLNKESRRRRRRAVWHQNEDLLRDRDEEYRRTDPIRYAKRRIRSRIKPTFLYTYEDVRDYLRDRKDLICERRKERRESLFARRNIGFGHKVNQLKNYTIDSLIECRRR